MEKGQGEVYRLKAKLENAQQEQESLKQEMERNQGSVQRMYNERDKVKVIFIYYLSSTFLLQKYIIFRLLASWKNCEKKLKELKQP